MPKDINKAISVIELIELDGRPLKHCLDIVKMNPNSFYQAIETDENLIKRYTSACENRAEILENEMLKIADSATADTAQAARLQVETRKWLMGKLKPKKYGDKLDITTDGQAIIQGLNINFLEEATKTEDTDYIELQ